MGFLQDLKVNLELLKHNLRGEKMVIEYTLVEINPSKPSVHTTSRFTTQDQAHLRAQGYLKAEKWLEDMGAVGMPVYIKFVNWPQVDAAEYGNLETSSTLYDYYKSNAMAKWLHGFTRIALDPLDTKTLAGVAVVAVGGILGFFLLFGGM